MCSALVLFPRWTHLPAMAPVVVLFVRIHPRVWPSCVGVGVRAHFRLPI